MWFASIAHAQIIEDADLHQEGPNAVLQVRFLTPHSLFGSQCEFPFQ
ncbi:hypothetical protein LepocDRAFT_00004840, partial [Leptothrix ochracea L12]